MALNEIIQCLGRYSKSNLPMLILEDMKCAVNTIWSLGERERRIELYASRVPITDLICYAQGDSYDGILLRRIEDFSRTQQSHFTHVMRKLKSSERGKFIITTSSFNLINDELLKEFCKIKYPFVSLDDLQFEVASAQENRRYENTK